MNRSFQSTTLAAARDSLRAGDFEATLSHVAAILQRLTTTPLPLPLPGGLVDVDCLLDALGRKMSETFGNRPTSTGEGDWILATMIYEVGGHTPVIRDLATALPEPAKGLVLTLAGQAGAKLAPRALARTGLPPDSIHRVDAPGMTETFRNALRLFESGAPRRLFLMQHPDDPVAVAIAAALSAAGTEIWLLHHADGCPTAGLYLPGLRLIDFTPRACSFTRHVLGLRSTWLPLTCPDPGPTPPAFLKHGRLTTACSGSLVKTWQDSSCPYRDVLGPLLRATGGRHVHIGPLKASHLADLDKMFEREGIERSRFIHVPVATTLADGLREAGVDLLLNTWPVGGARTVVEAMAAGIPIVWHAPHETVARLRRQMAYPGAALWCHISDLTALVARVDFQWLSTQSRAARRHYEERHHPLRWHQFFAAPDSVADPPLPAGFDASRFLPVLWDAMLDLAIDTHDARLERQQEKFGELSNLKHRLQIIESELTRLSQLANCVLL